MRNTIILRHCVYCDKPLDAGQHLHRVDGKMRRFASYPVTYAPVNLDSEMPSAAERRARQAKMDAGAADLAARTRDEQRRIASLAS